MFRKFYDRAQTWQRKFNSSFGDDISTPKTRLLARVHTHLVDHAWIRRLWTNMYPLGANAWRSNQPGPNRFRRLNHMGIKSIINLRGPSAFAVYLFEKEACEAHGISLHNHAIAAFKLSTPETYLGLLELFDRVEKPVLIHCKSGADRAGLASALYLMDQENVPVEQAKAQLALKYVHRKNSKAGVLDHFLETYARDNRAEPMPIRRWLETRYDQAYVKQSFAAIRGERADHEQ